MLFRTFAFLVFLYFIVQELECMQNKHKPKYAIRNIITRKLKKRHVTTPRPQPTIPPPRWKNTRLDSSFNPGVYGVRNPAGYGPYPMIFNPEGATDFSRPQYTTLATGNTALGFFLVNSLAKVNSPSYHYYNTAYDYQGYIPMYDHYSIHHYYYNRESIPDEATIANNAVVVCAADSGSFCPYNTTSLCANNGAVICVANASSTVPCFLHTNERNTYCIRTTVPCEDNYSPECQNSFNGKASILIPCVSRVTVYAYNPARTHCVAVVALPAERKMSEGEIAIVQAANIFSAFAVRILGIESV